MVLPGTPTSAGVGPTPLADIWLSIRLSLGVFLNVLVNSQDVSWGGCGEVVEFASRFWLMSWCLSEGLYASHPPCSLSQLNWEFLQAERREMVPSALGHPRRQWLGGYLQDIHSICRSRAEPSASVPGTVRRVVARWEEQSLLLAQTDAWRCQEFGFCVAWVWSVPLHRVAAGGLVAATLAHLCSQWRCDLTASHLRPQAESLTCCLPLPWDAAAGMWCAPCLVNNLCQKRVRQWNLFKTRRIWQSERSSRSTSQRKAWLCLKSAPPRWRGCPAMTTVVSPSLPVPPDNPGVVPCWLQEGMKKYFLTSLGGGLWGLQRLGWGLGGLRWGPGGRTVVVRLVAGGTQPSQRPPCLGLTRASPAPSLLRAFLSGLAWMLWKIIKHHVMDCWK